MNRIRRAVIEGIASVLWGEAWATHAEEHECCNLSGCEITSIMPPIPWRAWLASARLLREVEKAHGTDVETILRRAEEMDANEGISRPYRRYQDASDMPRRFGECIAFESMGSGVSWTDDHAEIPFYEVPQDYGTRVCDLRFLADVTCEETNDRDPCVECGHYVSPGEVCPNCGTYRASNAGAAHA